MSAPSKIAVALGVATALGGLAVAAAQHGLGEALGGTADGDRLTRMQRSPQWRSGSFHNRNDSAATADAARQADVIRRYLANRWSLRPAGDIPLDRSTFVTGRSATPGPTGTGGATGGLAVTWFGHASVLVEIDQARVLLDPVWSARCSPSRHVGPRRLHPVPVSLADLGSLDAVVISHDHYDHLDTETVRHLASSTEAVFVVPLGVGAHLLAWEVPEQRIVELDWGQTHAVAGIELRCVEAQHFSGRGLRRNGTLWSQWVVVGRRQRVLFSGDTGWFDSYGDLAVEHGPFDVALMAIGSYDPAWREVHLDPEEAVRAVVAVGRPLMIPIHWATFTLAPHAWEEPVERAVAAAESAGVRLCVPIPGSRVEVPDAPPLQAWWRDLAKVRHRPVGSR